MIRDPSDGSVREIEHQPKPLEANRDRTEKPVLDTGSSGLPFGSTRPESLARLEKSREWLKNYRLGTTASTESSPAMTGNQRAEKDAT